MNLSMGGAVWNSTLHSGKLYQGRWLVQPSESEEAVELALGKGRETDYLVHHVATNESNPSFDPFNRLTNVPAN
jgi:hypothetical protein